MAITATNILVGARDIEIDSVNIGALEGGVQMLYERENVLHRVDQRMGVIAVDKIDETIRCKFTMKEATLENLRIAMSQPSYQLSTAGAKTTLNFGSQRNLPAGHAVTISGKAPGSDKTRTIYLRKCIVEEGGTHAYTKDKATVYEVTLICLVDSTQGEGYQVGYYEDDAGAFSFDV